MTSLIRAAGCALALGLLAGCAGDGGYYGGSVGYADSCYGRYPGEYCGYPVWSGSVFIGGRSYSGLHYRDGRDGREFWRDGWHRADR